MALPSYVTEIKEENREEGGKYLIPPRSGYTFPFQFQPDYYVRLITGDTYFQRGQDFGMLFWLSEQPWSDRMMKINLPHNSLHLRKQAVEFVFHEKGKKPEIDTDIAPMYIPLQPNVTYYANLSNLVNSENSFRMIFLHELLKK